jgi:hypothetical protein
LDELCHIADDKNSFIEGLEQLYHQQVLPAEIEARKKLLYSRYNNEMNVGQIVKWIWKSDDIGAQ